MASPNPEINELIAEFEKAGVKKVRRQIARNLYSHEIRLLAEDWVEWKERGEGKTAWGFKAVMWLAALALIIALVALISSVSV